jgi:protein-S-isoprenylcysteine O-methyltransferase Ste14
MAIREEYEKSGGWLFRWRSVLSLLLIPILAVALLDAHTLEDLAGQKLEKYWEIFSVCIAFSGLLIRCLTIGSTPKGTSGRSTKRQKAESLNTSGMYSIVRHPLYVGNFFIFLGVILFMKVWWLVLLGTLLYWLCYERIIFAEEAFLRDKFGDAFMKWAEVTPIIIPDFTRWRAPELPFSIKNVLKREFNSFFMIVASVTLLNVAEILVNEKRFYISEKWMAFFLTGFAIYLILWFLKKFTNLLRVEGR